MGHTVAEQFPHTNYYNTQVLGKVGDQDNYLHQHNHIHCKAYIACSPE